MKQQWSNTQTQVLQIVSAELSCVICVRDIEHAYQAKSLGLDQKRLVHSDFFLGIKQAAEALQKRHVEKIMNVFMALVAMKGKVKLVKYFSVRKSKIVA